MNNIEICKSELLIEINKTYDFCRKIDLNNERQKERYQSLVDYRNGLCFALDILEDVTKKENNE